MNILHHMKHYTNMLLL